MSKKGVTYVDAGVDIDKADQAVAAMKQHIESTYNGNVLSHVGNFGGLFGLRDDWVLVASVDGVGTKLQVATRAGRHNTIGRDLVHHCLDDLTAQGPVRPLFFLDYFGMINLDPIVAEQVVRGLCEALAEYNCPLLGGETAEMPGTYVLGQYDLVGMIVGIIARNKIIDGSTIQDGDMAIGLGSDGLGTNGYSLARKVVFEIMGRDIDDTLYTGPSGAKVSVADELLRVHRCYYEPLLPLMNKGLIKAAAHITGGGIPGNLVRVLPEGAEAHLDHTLWAEHTPPIFKIIREQSGQGWTDYFKAFNDGIGMTLVVSPEDVQETLLQLHTSRERAWTIGQIHIAANTQPAVHIHQKGITYHYPADRK